APGTRCAFVDVAQFQSIVNNLVSNAADAIQGQGAVRLDVSNCTVRHSPRRAEEPDPGEYIRRRVEDSGTGMSEEVSARACEPFFTTKSLGEGSGLGLSQVFGFAKQSGGGMRIETRAGKGTVVSVYLPSVDQAEALSRDVATQVNSSLSDDLAP